MALCISHADDQMLEINCQRIPSVALCITHAEVRAMSSGSVWVMQNAADGTR